MAPSRRLRCIACPATPSAPSMPSRFLAPIRRETIASVPISTMIVRPNIENMMFPQSATAAMASVPSEPIQ